MTAPTNQNRFEEYWEVLELSTYSDPKYYAKKGYEAGQRDAEKKIEEGDAYREGISLNLDEANAKIKTLTKALSDMMGLLERGELQRNIDHDKDNGWAIKALKMVNIIKNAHDILNGRKALAEIKEMK